MTKKSWFLAFAGVISILSGNASAALVTLNGNGFNVVYDSAATGLFGTPTLSGDGKTILFSPLNFVAASSGQGSVFTSSNVQFDITPTANYNLNGVSLVENGDYRLVDRAGNGPLAPAVDASGELRLTNLWNGVDVVTTNFSAGALTNVCTTSAGCGFSPWSASAFLNAPSAWLDAGVRVRIQNYLTAEAFYAGDSATIEKKQASASMEITPFTTVVPVPGAVWLFGSALAGFIGLRRKVSA
jgi:hypothetical protein